MSLNEEIIKIFIEGQLVRFHGFSLINNQVQKVGNESVFVFQLWNSRLELKDLKKDIVVLSLNIPKDIDSKNCMSFAMESYLQVKKIIEKEERL